MNCTFLPKVPILQEPKQRRQLLISITMIFLWGIIAHGFALTNLMPSHDSLYEFYASDDINSIFFSVGRVLFPIYRKITVSTTLLPWLNGCIALFWMSICCFLIAEMFEIRNCVCHSLLAGILVTNRSVYTLFATYSHDANAYFFSLLLAVSAVFCWKEFTKNKNYKILLLGAALLSCSIGIYQSYITTALVLIILLSLDALWNQENANTVFKNGLSALGMILTSLIFYAVLVFLIGKFTGVGIRQEGDNSIDVLNSLSEPIYLRVFYAYQEAVFHFTKYAFNIYPQKLIILFNLIVFGCTAILFVLRMCKTKPDKNQIILMFALLCILPFAAEAFRLFSEDVHDLMTFAIWLFFLIPLILLNKLEPCTTNSVKYLCTVLCAALLFLSYSDCKTANLAYVHKKMQYDATKSVMTSILHDVETLDGYVPGETPVLFLGSASSIQKELPDHGRLRCLTGLDGKSPISYCWQEYFDYVLQRDINVLPEVSRNTIPDGVEKMPAFPAPGYVSQISDVIVVKLSKD